MMNEAVIEKIKDIICSCISNKRTNEIEGNTHLHDDLDIDSLKIIQIICEIENEFDVEINVGDINNPIQDDATFQEFLDSLENLM